MAVLTQPARSESTGKSAVQPPAAEFHHVSKTYSDVWFRRPIHAIRDVSFRIERGEVFGLLGPNRSGKTTLVKLLLSLCRPTAGAVHRFSRPAAERATLAQIGYVHENHAFPRYLTAAGLLEYYAALALVPYETALLRVRPLLERFGLADRSREPIARFSKGMLQRLGMAQALVNEPDLLVLDEPTEGLDLSGRQLMRDVVRERRANGGSVLLVTHIVSEVEQLCDRIGVLVNGRLVHVGPLAELTGSRPRSVEQTLKELYAGGAK
jgi:ABC-2 type transport system ATP-binding protein